MEWFLPFSSIPFHLFPPSLLSHSLPFVPISPFHGLLTVVVVPPSDFSFRSLSFFSISLMKLSLGRVACCGGGPPDARLTLAVPEPGGKAGTTFAARPKVIVWRPEAVASLDSVSVDCQKWRNGNW